MSSLELLVSDVVLYISTRFLSDLIFYVCSATLRESSFFDSSCASSKADSIWGTFFLIVLRLLLSVSTDCFNTLFFLFACSSCELSYAFAPSKILFFCSSSEYFACRMSSLCWVSSALALSCFVLWLYFIRFWCAISSCLFLSTRVSNTFCLHFSHKTKWTSS